MACDHPNKYMCTKMARIEDFCPDCKRTLVTASTVIPLAEYDKMLEMLGKALYDLPDFLFKELNTRAIESDYITGKPDEIRRVLNKFWEGKNERTQRHNAQKLGRSTF